MLDQKLKGHSAPYSPDDDDGDNTDYVYVGSERTVSPAAEACMSADVALPAANETGCTGCTGYTTKRITIWKT